jgi:hypothetical protein
MIKTMIPIQSKKLATFTKIPRNSRIRPTISRITARATMRVTMAATKAVGYPLPEVLRL